MITLLSDVPGENIPEKSPLEQVFEALFRVKQDVSIILGGQRREMKKGNIFTVQSLQTALDLIGELLPIDPKIAEAVHDTTDKFLRIIPIDGYVLDTDTWRVTEAQMVKLRATSERIPFPSEARTMFDLMDILQNKYGGK